MHLIDLDNFQAMCRNSLYRFLVSFNPAVGLLLIYTRTIYYISMLFVFGGVGLICYYITITRDLIFSLKYIQNTVLSCLGHGGVDEEVKITQRDTYRGRTY